MFSVILVAIYTIVWPESCTQTDRQTDRQMVPKTIPPPKLRFVVEVISSLFFGKINNIFV